MIAAIIQARMGSTRLPGKVMMNLSGKPVLWHVVNRVAEATHVDYVIIATTTNKEDDRIENFSIDNNIAIFRGSSNDVLKRYADTARMIHESTHNLKLIVRITSDCPLIDPDIIDQIIIKMKNSDYDYVSNTLEPTFPDGLDVEVCTLSALFDADLKAQLPSEREHVTPYLKTSSYIRRFNVKNSINLSSMRWVLDQEEDYKFINEMYKYLYNPKKLFKTKDILELLENRPDIIHGNNSIYRDEGYKKSLIEDAEYLRRREYA